MTLAMRGRLRSSLVRAAYCACLVLVLSFILFEVLDIDGSDFPTPHAALRVASVEPPHDLKRLVPSTPKLAPDRPDLLVGGVTTTSFSRLAAVTIPAAPPSDALGSPLTLPRASLDDQPPAA